MMKPNQNNYSIEMGGEVGGEVGGHMGEEGEEAASAYVEEMLSVDPIMAYPELTDGLNEASPSAELKRSFKLVLPDGYDAEQSYPLLFAYPGLGGPLKAQQHEEERAAPLS